MCVCTFSCARYLISDTVNMSSVIFITKVKGQRSEESNEFDGKQHLEEEGRGDRKQGEEDVGKGKKED